MCGIVGIVAANPTPPEAQHTVLAAMASRLLHRGPDADGYYCQGAVGLGHRRLSIIDLAGGAQPMQTADGALCVTFNGEIFNFIELRQALEQKGYKFSTHSDTEVILHLYREYGMDFPNKLNGQFAIGLWDVARQQLILVRDRVGICPLYYYFDSEQLVFASEIKALAPALPHGFTLNNQALDDIFTGWTCLPPETIFRDIWQVQPGEMLIVSDPKNITRQFYWQLNYPQNTGEYDRRTENQLIDELHHLLTDATSIRLRSDVPIGAYLSGGLDSSVLVALMHKQINAQLHTFSLGFTDPALDESAFQDRVVNFLGTQHSRRMIDYNQIAQSLVQTIWHTESPILRTAPVPMGLLSQWVHEQGYKVVLTGEGADEVLGGYDIFKEAKVRQFWAKQPSSSWRPQLLTRLYPYMELPKGDASVYLKRFFGVGLETPELLWHSHMPRWQTTSKAKLFFSDNFAASLNDNFESKISRLFPPQAANWHVFNRAQFLEIKTLMSGYLLTSQGDRMLTKHSVEGRFPFLDHRLMEFANRLPPKFKMKAMREKYLLRRMASIYLPPDISLRHKQPYRAPNVAASQDALFNSELADYLTADTCNRWGIFTANKVGFLLQKARAAKALNTSEAQALTGILTTHILLDQFCSRRI
ncbi:MAG TPA: asparagine synthase (glutamine-hydrolyzing) [Cellvibrionaceae bacterium]